MPRRTLPSKKWCRLRTTGVVRDDRTAHAPSPRRRGSGKSGRTLTMVTMSRPSTLAQIDLSQDAGVVPPAAHIAPDRGAAAGRGRRVSRRRPSHAHHEVLVPRARLSPLSSPRTADSRRCGPPRRRPLSHTVARLFTDSNRRIQLECGARGRQLEVLAVPPDAPKVAARRIVGRVCGVRDRDPRQPWRLVSRWYPRSGRGRGGIAERRYQVPPTMYRPTGRRGTRFRRSACHHARWARRSRSRQASPPAGGSGKQGLEAVKEGIWRKNSAPGPG